MEDAGLWRMMWQTKPAPATVAAEQWVTPSRAEQPQQARCITKAVWLSSLHSALDMDATDLRAYTSVEAPPRLRVGVVGEGSMPGAGMSDGATKPMSALGGCGPCGRGGRMYFGPMCHVWVG